MLLWWIGNAIFAFVVIPVVITLLNNLTEPIVEIRRYADDGLEHGVLLIANMDAIEHLEETVDQARRVEEGVRAYGEALMQFR
ncbi:MAG: hypothetical protein M3173_03800 [Chloroflexota bacterium]|nr:hypothetical protein [Chloroflexota bacterium]